jgi:hypothetical protein
MNRVTKQIPASSFTFQERFGFREMVVTFSIPQGMRVVTLPRITANVLLEEIHPQSKESQNDRMAKP